MMNSPYFDETPRLLRETLRRFVAKEVVPQAPAWEEQGFVPRQVLREMGRCGFLGLRHPEKYHGGGMGALATALLAEELGRSGFGGFAATVLVHTDMASPHLARAGSPAQLERWMPGIVAGDLITAVAVTEPDAGSDVKSIRTAARREGGGWRLRGSKTFITNGALAAMAMGESARALELTLEYVRTRKAFGAPLWDKQALRQRLAALAARIEAGRELVCRAAWLDAQGRDCVKEVSMAKAYCGELVNEVMYDCLQFHGGAGYMRGSDIERMARDARVQSIGGGATEVMLEEVAKRL